MACVLALVAPGSAIAASSTALVTFNSPNQGAAECFATESGVGACSGSMWGMAAGTSPSSVTLPDGNVMIAFNSPNQGAAECIATATGISTCVGSRWGEEAGTSPSAVVLPDGHVMIAFYSPNQGAAECIASASGISGCSGSMWGMTADTSPSAVALPGGKVLIAFNSPDQGAAECFATEAGMGACSGSRWGEAAGSSPSAVALKDGNAIIAFYSPNQGAAECLATASGMGTCSGSMWGMTADTSPSAAAMPNGDVAIAFNSPNQGAAYCIATEGGMGACAGSLWGEAAGSSPSAIAFPNGNALISFYSPNQGAAECLATSSGMNCSGSMWGMGADSSPSAIALPDGNALVSFYSGNQGAAECLATTSGMGTCSGSMWGIAAGTSPSVAQVAPAPPVTPQQALSQIIADGEAPQETILPSDITSSMQNLPTALASDGQTAATGTPMPAAPSGPPDPANPTGTGSSLSGACDCATQEQPAALSLAASDESESDAVVAGLNPALDSSGSDTQAQEVSTNEQLASQVASAGDPSPTPPNSTDTYPDIEIVPIYTSEDWYWDFSGHITLGSSQELAAGVKFVSAGGGWWEWYDQYLGWSAVYSPSGNPTTASSVTLPYYAYTAHPTFASLPVFVGWTAPPTTDMGGGNDLIWSDSTQDVGPDGGAADTEATAASSRSHCVYKAVAQTYYDASVPGSWEYQFGRTKINQDQWESVRWCWNASQHTASFAQNPALPPYTPDATVSGWEEVAGVNAQSASYVNSAPFKVNGYRGGGVLIEAQYVMNGNPFNVDPTGGKNWTDDLYIAGTYENGKAFRCSTNNASEAGLTDIYRVGGPNTNSLCKSIFTNNSLTLSP